jgi:predicted  nucleic acid-binding Zn-ribbon protein
MSLESHRAKKHADRKDTAAAAKARTRRAAVESLETRVLLSGVSDQVLAGPVGVQGNSWTYELSTANGNVGTETLTSKGTTTYNGLPAIELDSVDTAANTTATGKNFYAFLQSGYVAYDAQTTSAGGAVDDTVYSSPYDLVIPATLNPGTAVTTPTVTETDTVTPAGGSPSSGTATSSDVITLATATASVPIVVGGTTYMCYQINSTETYTPTDGTQTVDMSQTFTSPTVGLVEVNDLTTGNIMKLRSFTGSTYQLAVLAPGPTNTLAGDTISPAVQVALQSPSGATDTNASDAVSITASIASGSTSTATLSGTTQVTTVDGVATFSSLSINKPGTYTLNFTDSVGRTVSSGSFQVSAGKLKFLHVVKDGVAASSLDPDVEVELVDSKGAKITDAPSLVTLNISGTNSSNSITGNTAQLVDGVAVFSSLKLATPGTYTLNASDDQGDVNILSNSFEITGTHLVFEKDPAKAGVGGPLRYTIVLKDAKDKTVNASNAYVQLTLNTIDGGDNAALSVVSDILTGGIANNSDGSISINSPGTYTLTATEFSESDDTAVDATTPATSKPFQIVADHLVFTKSPASTSEGTRLRYEVELEDYKNQPITTASDHLLFHLNTIEGGAGATLAASTDTLENGVATNAGTSPLSINAAGTYTLTVIDVPPAGDPVATGAISKEFEISL